MKALFRNDYLTLWDDGSITISDGVGFSGKLEREEVKELFNHMIEFFLGEEGKKYDCPIHGLQDGPECPRC